jgi:predicted transcriptional regulator
LRRPIQLGELELQVLEYLWSQGPSDAKAVHAAIGHARHITLNTVQSTLKRLEEKEILSRSKVSHAFVYAPRLSRQSFHGELLQQLSELTLKGTPDVMVAAFVDLAERAGLEHLERLETLVEARLRQRRDGDS